MWKKCIENPHFFAFEFKDSRLKNSRLRVAGKSNVIKTNIEGFKSSVTGTVNLVNSLAIELTDQNVAWIQKSAEELRNRSDARTRIPNHVQIERDLHRTGRG